MKTELFCLFILMISLASAQTTGTVSFSIEPNLYVEGTPYADVINGELTNFEKYQSKTQNQTCIPNLPMELDLNSPDTGFTVGAFDWFLDRFMLLL